MKWNTQLRVTRYTYLHVIINGNNNHIARSKRDCGVDVGECRRRIKRCELNKANGRYLFISFPHLQSTRRNIWNSAKREWRRILLRRLLTNNKQLTWCLSHAAVVDQQRHHQLDTRFPGDKGDAEMRSGRIVVEQEDVLKKWLHYPFIQFRC